MGFAGSASGDVAVVRGVPLERGYLSRLRRWALRSRAWFRLGAEDRRFLELVIAIVDGVRSRLLARVLEPILGRLMEAMRDFQGWLEAIHGRVRYWMMVRGWGLAQRLSQLAQSWGNRQASGWAEDQGFIQYLAIIELNRPKIWQ